MRPLAATLLALVALAPAPRIAAASALNLGWANCNSATNADRTFACDDNATTLALIGSFRLSGDVPDFLGVGAFVDFAIAGGAVPPWWQFGPGDCGEGRLGPVSVGTISGCVSPWAGAGAQGGGATLTSTGPGSFRVEIGWLRDTAVGLAANTLYSAFRLQLGTAGSVDEGQGACPGCATPACIVLARINTITVGPGNSEVVTLPDARNWVTWQGGTGDCPGATPSRAKTWGAIKALYR